MLLLFFSILLSFTGIAYFLYLGIVFPTLVPHHGAGERFTLDSYNNFTYQIPWSAYTRLHLTMEANETVRLYADSDFLCDCLSHEFIIEPGDDIFISLKSNSTVSGRFSAWQEIPLERQLLATILLLAGFAGIAVSYIRISN